MFVVYVEVELPFLGWQYNCVKPSAACVAAVDALAVVAVPEVPSCVFVEASCREGEAGRDAVVVRQRSVTVAVSGRSQPHVGALVSERRLGIDFDKPAHRVAPVEHTLRSAQDLYLLDVGIVEVESRLVYVGNVVHVQSYGGCIDARTDASDVDCRCQFRPVVGDKEVGDEGGEALDAAHLFGLYVLLCQSAAGYRQFVQVTVFLGGGDDDHFLHLYGSQCVGLVCVPGCGGAQGGGQRSGQ